jgi:type I site-specific restriction-modification system R (restriction) subunit
MAISPEDLEEVLKSVGEEFLSAKEAQSQSISSELPLAKSTLKQLVALINKKIAKTERSLIEKVPISNESPAISLVIAALEKKNYVLEVSGDKSYTQFIINW